MLDLQVDVLWLPCTAGLLGVILQSSRSHPRDKIISLGRQVIAEHQDLFLWYYRVPLFYLGLMQSVEQIDLYAQKV